MGTKYVPPQIKLRVVDSKGNSLSEIYKINLGDGIPFRSLTWNKKIQNILVCDGRGTKYKDIFESESLYSFNKHLITENNMRTRCVNLQF